MSADIFIILIFIVLLIRSFDAAGEAFHRLKVPEIAHFKRAS